jgi:periplasmic protein TonB
MELSMKKYLYHCLSALHNLRSTLFGVPQTALLELVFERKNKAYGAYALRTQANHTLGRSILYSFSAIGLFCLSAHFSLFSAEVTKEQLVSKPEPKGIIYDKPITIIPLPKEVQMTSMSRKTIIFIPPIVVPEQTKITERQSVAAVDQVLASDAAVGLATQLSGSTSLGDPQATDNNVVVADPDIDSEALNTEEIRDFAEEEALYEGGEEALMLYLQKAIKYPQFALETGIKGRVVVQFVVETDGSIKQAKVLKDIGGGCGKEALRVVNHMPAWIPARQNGHLVRVRKTLPITFQLK